MTPEKLESYESGKSLEKIEELSQAIARLTAENRSTRGWFKTRLQLLWESISDRDDAIAESMKGLLEHAEEMSRHIGLRETGDKLDALLKVPLPPPTSTLDTFFGPRSTQKKPPVLIPTPLAGPSTFNQSPAATPNTSTRKETPLTTAEKRQGDEIFGEKKRRKIGEP